MSEEEVAVETAPVSSLENLNDDQLLRCFIFERLADSNIDGNILVENMQSVFAWIKDAKVKRSKPQLKEVT